MVMFTFVWHRSALFLYYLILMFSFCIIVFIHCPNVTFIVPLIWFHSEIAFFILIIRYYHFLYHSLYYFLLYIIVYSFHQYTSEVCRLMLMLHHCRYIAHVKSACVLHSCLRGETTNGCNPCTLIIPWWDIAIWFLINLVLCNQLLRTFRPIGGQKLKLETLVIHITWAGLCVHPLKRDS